MKTKRKLKLKKDVKNFLLHLIILTFLFLLSFSIFKIVMWKNDNNILKNIEKDINKSIIIENVINNEDAELINEPDNKDDVYWKYLNTSLIDVNINKLKEENSDTVAWVQVLGTNINYPVVKTTDNKYYLNHDFTKNKNKGGWIFLDYRNDLDNMQENNIIYGHRRFNNSMFGTLINVTKDYWLKNQDNHIIKISTINYNYLFQIFSVYFIEEETYYIQTEFSDSANFQDFINTIKNRSIHDFNTEVNSEAKILTLSTCHNENDRLVVHAKLIKRNEKSIN